MQQCCLTDTDARGNELLTTLTPVADGLAVPVRFLLCLWDRFYPVSKESKNMLNQSSHKKNMVSIDTLSKLAGNQDAFDALKEARTPVSRKVVIGSATAFETFLVSFFGTVLWVSLLGDFSARSIGLFLPIAIFVGVAIPALLQVNNLFRAQSYMQFMHAIPKLIGVWAAVFSAVFVFVFFTKIGAEYSRLWLATWAGGSFLSTLAFRAGLSVYIKNRNQTGQMDRRAVLVGGGQPAENLINAFNSVPDSDVSIIGVFDDRGDDRSPTEVGNLRKLGTIDELLNFARQTRVDMLIVTLPLVAEQRLLELLKRLWVLPVDIRLSAYSQKLRYKSRAYSYIGNIPLLDVFDKPLSDWNAILKNLEDKVLAFVALVFLAPVMGLVALAVKLDSPGPVIFRQKRYGFNNELIEVFKFRSMYTDQTDHKANKLVTRNDPRVTRVGRFIRKTSLDELPQFVNVLRGELSLVGPRPHPTQAKAKDSLYTDVVDGYFARHRVKPGITGWAQINGWRGETDTEEKLQRRVEHDLFYIENWSLFFDLYILAKTPFSLLETENAY